MSRLLLAKAAGLLRWCPERWRDGWPDLLTAHEIARLEAPDNRETERAVLGVFMQDPPPADGTAPGFSISTWRSGFWDGDSGWHTAEGSPLSAYRAATYRDWPARDWEPSPLIAAWFDAHAPQDAPARDDSQGKPQTIIKQSALIAHIEPIMKEPDKLAGLLSNASKNGLSKCRAPGAGGWCLGEFAMWLLTKGYLKPEISKKYIDTLIEQAVNNS